MVNMWIAEIRRKIFFPMFVQDIWNLSCRHLLISILCKNYAENPMGDKNFRRGYSVTKLMVYLKGKYLLYVYELITLTCVMLLFLIYKIWNLYYKVHQLF